jgi:hypothetical protein
VGRAKLDAALPVVAAEVRHLANAPRTPPMIPAFRCAHKKADDLDHRLKLLKTGRKNFRPDSVL